MAQGQNGLALYLLSRGMVELGAFLHEVRTRLVEAASRDADDWRAAGELFFGILVRARFATTRQDYQAILRDAGLSETRIKPFNVMNCIRGLAKEREHEDAETHYEKLCDFVHHNLAGATTANAGSAVADIALSPGGGGIVMPVPGMITQYEYPLPRQYERALEDTAPGFVRDTRACIRWINEIPQSPYPEHLVETVTGNRRGFTELRPPFHQGAYQGTGRNDLCPCGSGRKYKYCCGGPALSQA